MDNRGNHGPNACLTKTMWFIIAVLVAVSGALVTRKVRVRGRDSHANLGRMSGEWLAEHGASTRY